jgi:thioredoxin-related protein
MRKMFAALFLALMMTIPRDASHAGLDRTSAPLPNGTLELVVVEASGCIYCDLFRRDVLPAYETSEQGKEMPVRFVDINDVESEHIGLTAPVEVVPTFVVVKSQREVGRVSGYVGPENFFHSINYLVASAP